MKLILQKDVKNLGKAGDQVRVKNGFARNYLLPNNLALILNKNRLKEWKHRKSLIEAKKKHAVKERKSLLDKISAVEIVFEKESRNKLDLFGSVTAPEISNALEKKHRLSVDKRDIKTEALKQVGEFQIPISLDSENTASLKVIIKAKTSEKAEKKSRGFFAKTFFQKQSPTSETEAPENPESPEDKPPESKEESASKKEDQ